MSEHQENQTQGDDNLSAASADAPTQTRKRVQSEIEFPYADLETSVELAAALQTNAGHFSEDEELAGWLNQSADGGTYRARRSAARMFGLIETTQGRVSLTQLGREVVTGSGARAARVEAFLKPALYAAVYDKYRGAVLPPAAAIERLMEQLGVSPKQKDRARQAFMKSATFAGYVDPNNGRLIKPGNIGLADDPVVTQQVGVGNGGGGAGDGGGSGLHIDPLLMALLQKIPAKADGWNETKRVRWFRTFAMNVSQVYDDDEKPVEMRIDLAPND